MAASFFSNVCVRAIKTVIPDRCIDIDDEIEFFNNDPKKLARAKKMAGYGRRYILDEDSTVTDMCVDAAEKLISELIYPRDKIDLLLFVNQKPDFPEPSDACLAHGRLGLKKSCAALSVSLGCSGYPYGLWLAHSMLQSGAAKRCLLLVGDAPTRVVHPRNRKSVQLFGDAASATLLEKTTDGRSAYFRLGTDGANWDKLIVPFGGLRLPMTKNLFDLHICDSEGNFWAPGQSLMHGVDVFSFSTEVASREIKDILNFSGMDVSEIDFFAIHQANKQIVETIVAKAGIPSELAPTETFTKYANNSTNSVVTVLCDQLKDRQIKYAILCAFGIGLSWGTCLLDLSGMYNGGISTFTPVDRESRQQQAAYWINFFKGEME